METHNIGDRLVALNSTTKRNTQPRIRSKIYIVRNVHTCENCGSQYVNFGYETKVPKRECNLCECTFLSKNLKWTQSKFYINLKDVKKTLKQSIKEEDYQLAITLRDINKINSI